MNKTVNVWCYEVETKINNLGEAIELMEIRHHNHFTSITTQFDNCLENIEQEIQALSIRPTVHRNTTPGRINKICLGNNINTLKISHFYSNPLEAIEY